MGSDADNDEDGASMRALSDDESEGEGEGEGDESDPNCISKRELTAKEQGQRTEILKRTVQGARHFCQTTASRVQEDAPYEVFASHTSRDTTNDYDLFHWQQWYPQPLEIGKTYEEKVRSQGEVSSDRRVQTVTTPKVVARASLPTAHMCYCCGLHTGTDVQTPNDVFAVGFRLGGHAMALRCVKQMAELLEAEDFVEVTRRTACCRMATCMLAQNRLTTDHYEGWYWSKDPETGKRRFQLEKGTDRKDQGLEISENLVLLHCLAVQHPPVLSNEQLEALWRWVVAHSQFVQEREKRFIATAVAVANNPHLFGYEFGDPQSLVNRMAAFPRNYAHRLIFKHVLRSDLNRHKWKSGINKLLEASMPKPYDVIYALMCEDNWHNQHRPRDADGRPVHRVTRGAPHAKTFNVCHFKKGLQAAIACPADPDRKDAGLDLYFQDARSVGSQTGSLSNPREQRELNKLLTGSRKAGKTRGFGVADFPTCGSRQKTSSAHPAERYAAVFDAQGTYSLAEREDILSLFLDSHEDGNTVGRELQKPGDQGSLSKACAVIRRIEIYDPPTPAPTSLRRVADAPMQALPKSFRPMGGGKAIRKRTPASTPPNRGSPTSPRHPC
jgi:hypothetical protein